jgi:acyl-CoA synthetase (AMP-forming)/AMP-acid ligase II
MTLAKRWPRIPITEILRARAEEPARTALRFLIDGTDTEVIEWSYRDLADHAALIAAELLRRGLRGQRVVLALDPGPHYVAALFGILWAQATAVPSFPPAGRRAIPRFLSIVANCQPAAIITEPRYAASIDRLSPGSELRPRCIFADDSLWRQTRPAGPYPSPCSADPALLQYTSGSTGDPKGIVLSHDNLVSNCFTLDQNIGSDPTRVGCSWLPPYHDMGLLSIMLAIYGGWPLVMLSPMHFIQRPSRWLAAITSHQVTISVAPAFALDTCAENITDSELGKLDLGSLRQLFCGAEPIMKGTIDKFSERFSRCGYRDSALIPSYGLAEATLFVSGKRGNAPARIAWVDREGLEGGQARPATPGGRGSVPLVSCGVPADGHRVLIVDPHSRRQLPPGQVGEIWVSGPNVAHGYLGKPQQTRETFAARIVGPGTEADLRRSYLRTGDLGFVSDGELLVTGRVKDVIIIAGRNIYPQDIERTACRAQQKLRLATAFSVPSAVAEELVVVAEFRGTARRSAADLEETRNAVIAAIAAEHGIKPFDVCIGPAGTVPLTTSGKVCRDAARKAYRQGTLTLRGSG